MQCIYCHAPEGKAHASNCLMRSTLVRDVMTATTYPHSKNGTAFKDGMEFQDWVVERFNRLGFYIQLHASKRYQFDRGESVQRVEIKLDTRCTETGRLSIEVEERTAIDKPWVRSGIYCNDNSVFYVQGNYERVYLFDKRVLRRYHNCVKSGAYEESPRDVPTVRKFYMPFADADENCIWCVDNG